MRTHPGCSSWLAGLTIVIPGALLSAVTPMVIKLMLTTLKETGTVVGRLSGIGTVGAIFGTVVTGFVLISRVPVTGIMLGLGLLLLVAAIVVEIGVRRRPPVLSRGADPRLCRGCARCATGL